MGDFITNPRIDGLLRDRRVGEALREPVRLPAGIDTFIRRQAARDNCTLEDLSYAGLTLGKFLYEYIRIDPDVVRAVEFARASDVDSVLSFARFAETKSVLTGASLDGLHSELQGYVAEQIVAHHLVTQGHDVSFPHTANNAGWDLMVDGHPFQVKCLTESSGVLEHLHRYPGIPAIVNSELAGRVGDHAGVYIDPQLHHEAVCHVTAATLDRGREMADFEIPWVSLAVSGAYNLLYMVRNETDLRAMATCTVIDTAGRVAGGAAGKLAGTGAGLLIFGPAGAIVVGLIGTIGGSAAGRRVASGGRMLFVADQESAVRTAARNVAAAAVESMPQKISAWRQKQELMGQCLSGPGISRTAMQAEMNRMIADEIDHWNSKKKDLENLAQSTDCEPRGLVEQVFLTVRRAGIHIHHIQDAANELADKLREYTSACKRFRIPT